MSIASEIAPRQPRTIEEIINPHDLPEAGFQSYTELVNNALDQREDFIAGKSRNPRFEHRRLRDMSALDKGVIALGRAREEATDREPDSVFREAIGSSLAFRMAEMEYVKLLGQLPHEKSMNLIDLEAVRAFLSDAELRYIPPDGARV